ncbi:DoxX family membrane protein [Candidatus Woesearchaeota archaeon]|nr:DoxX family membrane protein [Candidatus Woesearchaeota archaeon]
MKDKTKIATLILRVALGFIFFWFGMDKIINPIDWKGFITPALSKLIFVDLGIFILLLGIIEIILGIMLILGLFTRTASVIVLIHLIMVVMTQGFNQISIRDFGLIAIALYLIMIKSDYLSLKTK